MKEKEAHIEQLLQEFEMERAELAKITTEREMVSSTHPFPRHGISILLPLELTLCYSLGMN